jgi:hypothetical protein
MKSSRCATFWNVPLWSLVQVCRHCFPLSICLTHFTTQKLEAVRASLSSVTVHQTTRRHNIPKRWRVPFRVASVRTSTLPINSFPPLPRKSMAFSDPFTVHSYATYRIVFWDILTKNRNWRTFSFRYEYQILQASGIKNKKSFKTFLSLMTTTRATLHGFCEARLTTSVLNANSERM